MLLRKQMLLFLLVACFIGEATAEYEIRGKLNMSANWQHQIFLATVHKMDDYYNANPEFIIQVGNIEEDGSFILRGDNLPLEKRFYRLYLVKEENTEFDACLYFEENELNFIHLILDNNTKVEIQTASDHFAPFGDYQVIGEEANKQLRELSLLVTPSFYFHQIKFPSELQFSQQKLNRDLFAFADSCEHILVSLAAIINTDMDKYFEMESVKYLDFGQRLSAQLNNHSYTEDYFRKMNYYNGDSANSSLPNWVYYLLTALIAALLIAVIRIISLQNKIKKIAENNKVPGTNQIPSFTKQEEKILSLILAGKSNKEIATELFIELSTVKTHINKLYAKLGAKNRSEAKSIAKTLELVGV